MVGGSVDVYGIMQPIFAVSTIFGLAPWVAERSSSFITFKRTWYGIILTFTVFILLTAQLASSNYYKFVHEFRNQTTPYIISNFLHGSTCSIAALLSILCGPYWFLPKIQEIFNRINTIDHFLCIPEQKNKKLKYWLCTIGGITLSILSAYMISDFLLRELNNSFFYVDLGRNLVFQVDAIVNIQFLSIIVIIWHRFRTLNKYLNALQYNLSTKETGRSFHVGLYKPAWGSHSRTGVFSAADKKSILTLRTCHEQLFDTCQLVMHMYGPVLLVLITFYFNTCLLCLYHSIKLNQHGRAAERNLSVGWGMLCVVSLLLTAMIAQLAVSECNCAPGLVKRAQLTRGGLGSGWELHQFSVQLLHSHLQLSVCGFFCLNSNLLLGLMGAFATYLVIMLQNG